MTNLATAAWRQNSCANIKHAEGNLENSQGSDPLKLHQSHVATDSRAQARGARMGWAWSGRGFLSRYLLQRVPKYAVQRARRFASSSLPAECEGRWRVGSRSGYARVIPVSFVRVVVFVYDRRRGEFHSYHVRGCGHLSIFGGNTTCPSLHPNWNE